MMNPQEYEDFQCGIAFFKAYNCFEEATDTLETLLERIRPYEEQDEEKKEYYPEGSVSTIVYSNQIVRFVYALMLILLETGFGMSMGDKILRFPDTDKNLTFIKMAGKMIPLLKIPHEEDICTEFEFIKKDS